MNLKRYFNSFKITLAFIFYIIITFYIIFASLSNGSNSSAQSGFVGNAISDAVSVITNDKVDLKNDGKTDDFPESITLSTSKTEYTVGERDKITYAFSPEKDYSYIEPTFSSSNSLVVSVDDKGNLEFLSVGTATVTVSIKGSSVNESKTFTVTEDIFEPYFNIIKNDESFYVFNDESFYVFNDGVGNLYKLLYDTNLKYQSVDITVETLDGENAENSLEIIKTATDLFLYTKQAGNYNIKFKTEYVDFSGTHEFTKIFPLKIEKLNEESNAPIKPPFNFESENITLITNEIYKTDFSYQRVICSSDKDINAWSTDNKTKLAIYGKKVGTYKIVFYYVTKSGLQKTEIAVTVLQGVPEESSFKNGYDYIKINENLTLTPTGDGISFDASEFTWSSSNEKLATVENGVVKGKKFGKVTITATSKNIEGFSISYTFRVRHSYEHLVRKIIGHFLLFTALAFFATIVYYRLAELIFKNKKILFAIIITLLVGLLTALLSEFLQSGIFTIGRSSSIKDVFIDFSGYILGFIFIGIIYIAVNKIKKIKNNKNAR